MAINCVARITLLLTFAVAAVGCTDSQSIPEVASPTKSPADDGQPYDVTVDGQLSDKATSTDSKAREAAEDDISNARIALDAGEWQEAIDACSSALEHDLAPIKRSLAYYFRGIAHEESELNDEAIADFTASLASNPHLGFALYSRGKTYFKQGQYDKAFPDWMKAAELDGEDYISLNAAALLLASSPNSEHRDGAKAIELAKQACELTEWQDPICIATLACGFAATDDFDAAIEWQKKARTVLLDGQEPEDGIDMVNATVEIVEYTDRLTLYESGKPYRLDQNGD